MSGNLDRSAVVVDASLDSAMYAADSEPVGLVEVSDGLVVLTLLVLDHEPVYRVVGIDRQGALATIAPRIAREPIKAVLTTRGLPEDRVAQIDHVSLVRVRTRTAAMHGRVRPCLSEVAFDEAGQQSGDDALADVTERLPQALKAATLVLGHGRISEPAVDQL